MNSSKVPLRIGIVAAEPSGDLLAAGLMEALREQLPGVRFEGVAGPLMRASGIDAWEPMDSLSVMGLFEVLQHLPRLLRLRSRLLAHSSVSTHPISTLAWNAACAQSACRPCISSARRCGPGGPAG